MKFSEELLLFRASNFSLKLTLKTQGTVFGLILFSISSPFLNDFISRVFRNLIYMQPSLKYILYTSSPNISPKSKIYFSTT